MATPFLLIILSAEKLRKLIFLQFGTNHAEPACHIRFSVPDITLLRHIVKVDPAAVTGRHHPFRSQNHSINLLPIKLCQNMRNLLSAVYSRCFQSPGSENLIRMVVMMFLFVFMMMMVPVV